MNKKAPGKKSGARKNIHLKYITEKEEILVAIELFGNEWKEELFEDLVKLNIEAIKEANRRISKQFNMVSIKEVMKVTGWGRKRIEDFRDQGKFSYQQNAKGGKCLYDLDDVLRFQSQIMKRG